MTARLLPAALLLLAAPAARGQNDGGNDTGPDAPKPAVSWDFDGAAEPGIPKGGKTEPGPRPPLFPQFKPDNAALRLDAAGVTVREADFPDAKPLRFGNGDAITLEAWVKPADVKAGGYVYILGKGRNRKPSFPALNQNYALRLKGESGKAAVSFLFSSAPAGGKPADWHRWTTAAGFKPDGRWHHVAVSYTFGKPETVRGYIDGKAFPGTWDMGGQTDRPPVQDADDIVIGSGNGGGVGNTFHGAVDDVTIWRTALPADTLLARFPAAARTAEAAAAGAPPVKPADLPRGAVRVELCDDGFPESNSWPDTHLKATETYPEDVFGFFEVPHKYVETGVRGDRGNPFLLRAAAVVPLPAGKHRLLLRARGASRLWVDGKQVLTTPFPPPTSDGHNPVREPKSWLDLGPDFRFAPPGNRESWVTFESTGAEHVVVLETIVGSYVGKAKRRPELGETVVAISPQGEISWRLLSPGSRTVPYTDAGWNAYESERSAHYDAVNAAARAVLREKAAPYWNARRDAAKKWLADTAAVPVPPLPAGYPAQNAIDHFVADRIARVAAQQADGAKRTVEFFRQVQPILEAKCWDCHTGVKAKGKLQLDSLAAALRGGSGDGPAVTPGKPADSSLLARVKSDDPDTVMPPKGDRLTKEQMAIIEAWIREGASWPEVNAGRVAVTPLADDLAFLRRVSLDTVGVVPSVEEIAVFRADKSADRRAKVIDRLLTDPRWADNWVGYWQDVLAENPNILNPTLNNTGPFRWWLYESLLDNKPMDLFVTELVRMGGSSRFGGPAGFGVASQNDAPMAAKGAIVAAAFLGVEMKCARCHDAPAHASTQENLFSLAAMLGTKPIAVPATSSVPLDKIHAGGRKPLIQVTLKPGTAVKPAWPFPAFVKEELGGKLAEHPDNPRDRLAALVTAPQNERFAQVAANRVWKRFMGRGFVEPVDDWERAKPTHPELLKWLGRELVRGGYDLKHLSRLILNSHAYQRATDRTLKDAHVLYAAPAPRRLAAEQVVDSLFAAAGKPFKVEEASLDVDGQRSLDGSISLGTPRRAWMLTSTSNERDRPSLALPRIQAVCDVLAAFGWRPARQDPTSVREMSPNVLQPAILSNGTVGVWLTRLSDDHGVTDLALKSQPLDALLDSLFLRTLTRLPTSEERAKFTAHLSAGYESRMVPGAKAYRPPHRPVPYVSWSNHLDAKATVVRQHEEVAARAGDPPTARLDPAWRVRLEDVLWSLLNSPEFVFTP